MEQKLNFKNFITKNCSVVNSIEDGSTTVEFSPNGGELMLQGKPGELAGVELRQFKYLVFDVTNMEDRSVPVQLRFYEADNLDSQPTLIASGLFPGIKMTMSLPLEVLDAQTTFLPRTPGRFKTMVIGNKVDISKLDRFAIGTSNAFRTQTIKLENLRLTDFEPDYPLPDIKFIDELGQLKTKDWPEKTKNSDQLVELLRNELAKSDDTNFYEGWDKYGGWKGKDFEATGYFRTQLDGKRWWLVDPEGNVFISVGIDSVVPGEAGRVEGIIQLHEWFPPKDGEFHDAWFSGELFDAGEYYNFAVSNLIRAFGAKWWESWAKITRRRLIEWGINTIANWSSLEFARYAKLPYVCQLDDFPTTQKKIFRDFPDVFSPEFEINADKFALQMKEFVGDKYLIGYFLRNEPQWAFIDNIHIAEELLENEDSFYSKDAFIKYLSEKYKGIIEKFNEAWNTSFSDFNQLRQKITNASLLSPDAANDIKAFSCIMTRCYVELPSKACKRIDPNHMNLGMRYAVDPNNIDTETSISCSDNEALYAGCENFDVYTINCYKMNPAEAAQKIGEITKLPVMFGEFHFGALDRGLVVGGLRQVNCQEDRAIAYKYYVENAVAVDYCVGAHYFILNDQAVLGRYEGENYQVGCVDVCHKPYIEFINGVKATTKTIYEVAEGIIEKSNISATKQISNGI